jgi:hypothetical protein
MSGVIQPRCLAEHVVDRPLIIRVTSVVTRQDPAFAVDQEGGRQTPSTASGDQ